MPLHFVRVVLTPCRRPSKVYERFDAMAELAKLTHTFAYPCPIV